MKKQSIVVFTLLFLLSFTLPSTLYVGAAGFTPSTKTVPSNITLTTIQNFDTGLGTWIGGNAGANQDGSIVTANTEYGYGTSGGSAKWVYDKSKADWNAPSFRDSSETFYEINGDGFFMWIKADSAGMVRLEGLLNDWTTSVHCDVTVTSGENLVYFPYANFVKGDNSAATMAPCGYHLMLFAQSLANSGTVYIDEFGTYEEAESEPEIFTPSTKTVPSNITLTTIQNFNTGLGTWIAGNAGTNSDGSVVTPSTTFGYGTSGGSAKWVYDKSKADWNAPSFRDSSETFYEINGDGFFMWIKADSAGMVRLEGLLNDWTTNAHCDATIVAGENLVYFPYANFVKGDNSAVTMVPCGYHLALYAQSLANSGTVYIDEFGTYEEAESEPEIFTPSTRTVPSNITLTTIQNFNTGLGTWIAGNAGTNSDGSVVTPSTTFGYGTSGGSAKWVYDKSKADWNAPSFRDSSETFYEINGDGFFMWIKADSAGTVRLEGLLNDWTTSVHCDVTVTSGENLVYFPYANFVKGDNSAATMAPCGYHLTLFAQSLANSGTVYIDEFGTYEEAESEPEIFTPSTKTVPSSITLTTIQNFNTGLGTWVAGNVGTNSDGSVVTPCTTFGYGTSGGSAKWVYDKSKADWNAPSFRDSSESFYSAAGDGFFMWIKADSAGTVRLEGLQSDWVDCYCDAAVEAGENLVYFPYDSFVKADKTPATVTSLGYHLCLYAQSLGSTGTVYIDEFGSYDETTNNNSTIREKNATYAYKMIDDFNSYNSFTDLLSIWSTRNAGPKGLGSQMELDSTSGNSSSGNGLKIQYNSTESDWYSPGVMKMKPDNTDLAGDGFCFWLKNTDNISVRISFLTEDAEAVYDFKDVSAGEGYFYVPFKDLVYYQAGIETPYEELGFTPSDFYYFTVYLYPAGSIYAAFETTVWFDDMSFYSTTSFENVPDDLTSTPAPTTSNDETINSEVPAESENDPVNTGDVVPTGLVILLLAAFTTITITYKHRLYR